MTGTKNDRVRHVRAPMTNCAVALAALLASGAIGGGQAFAQTAAETAVTDGGSSDGDIIVTARRRDESSQNVPLSLSAFGPAQLEAQGVTTVKDLQHLIPGLQYSDRGTLQTELTIRGVGGDSRNIGIESGVGMYLDGVYIARTSGYNADLADIQQVEVLRGPQGTLYGKNTSGGVINIRTKKPTEKTEGSFYASYGNYDAIRTQASVSGALADTLFAKVTVATWDRNGYIRNSFDNADYNNEDRRGGRVQLRWLASDNLEINANADVTRDRQRFVLNQMNSPAGAAAPYFTGDRFRMNSDQRNLANRDMWGTSITADYTMANDMLLSSITAFRKIDILVYSDIDQTPLDLFHSGPFTDKSKMFSQELRIVSPGDKDFRYVGGLYYFRQDAKGIREVFINGSSAAGASNDAAVLTKSYAAYVNADYDITSDLSATGGLRYTIEDKSGRFFQRRTGLNYNFPNMSRKDKNLSWTGSLKYQFSPRLTGYGTVSRGYKSGGFNLDTIGAPNLIATDLVFGPESVTNFELGLKGRTASNLLRFTAAVFSMQYRDKQVSQFIPTGAASLPSNQVTNAGRARIRGIEGDITLRPFEGFSLNANGTYLDAKYTRFESAAIVGGVPISYAGNHIERTPKWTASATAEYRYPISGGDIVMAGSAKYIGDTDLQADNAARNFEPGYTLFDARLGFAADSGLDITLWGKNLGQKNYRTFARVFAGLDQAVYGEPRTYGVELRYHF